MSLLSFFIRLVLFAAGFIPLGYALGVGHLLPSTDQMSSALEKTSLEFHQNLDDFAVTLENYQRAVDELATSSEEIRRLHLETRAQFKEVEFLLEYAEPASVKRYLNGAPLPKTEPSVPEVIVLEPSGLQTLDELVFSDEIDRKEVAQLLKKLREDYRKLHQQMRGLKLQHRHIFEASREEVVRIFTLGVTGFDTPGSGAALPESFVALKSLQQAYLRYAPSVGEKAPTVNRDILEAFQLGRSQLRGGNFDAFDRLRFLREVINPLTKNLPRAQAALEIESAGDFNRMPRPTNLSAPYLFSPDWLSAEYFANLTESTQKESRRQLGELLFFDPILSGNLKQSCANCHHPGKAFTDGLPRSLSSEGTKTVLRNSPTLINSVYAEKYFYDLRETFLERQMAHVVADKHEFATDFLTIEQRLKESPEYVSRFAEAYADQPRYQLSKWSISDALSHYVMSLRGMNSDFDKYARGEREIIAEQVRRGFNLFMGKAACGTCHFAPSFNGLVPPFYAESESEVLGVPATKIWENATVDGDPGRIASGRPRDEAYFHAFAFKTPTVRNASQTAPYMHNGVYDTLEEVMDFYNRGGGAGIGINLAHQTLPPDALELTTEEISDVISFLESLDDFEHLNHQPETLPTFPNHPEWNQRKPGGTH
ncbi:cytochrome-c peroxidase [Lewinella sp. W8]|uniref:cytochrome-c peroxidase n=1 Tax=Lewinella sp. W8 TaxID=2528208 RepID=UPI0010681BBC|nr:cytochrome c peroxidase [Lewinella sp. W8]MTB49866.1 cytochrome-c peroxidase [Lewinella sp. W8]